VVAFQDLGATMDVRVLSDWPCCLMGRRVRIQGRLFAFQARRLASPSAHCPTCCTGTMKCLYTLFSAQCPVQSTQMTGHRVQWTVHSASQSPCAARRTWQCSTRYCLELCTSRKWRVRAFVAFYLAHAMQPSTHAAHVLCTCVHATAVTSLKACSVHAELLMPLCTAATR
jgi:hypothetical protein